MFVYNIKQLGSFRTPLIARGSFTHLRARAVRSHVISSFCLHILRHKKIFLTAGLLALALILFTLPDVALAAEGDTTNEVMKKVQDYFTILLQVISSWFWPLLLLIGGLMDNQLIFGGEMGERLLSIWVIMRNIVNVVFVLILLVIAVYNVLGLPEEGMGGVNFSLKQTLPKFAIALIAVNFSFLAAKVVLDFTNVLTVAAFSLPNTLIENRVEQQKSEVETQVCGGTEDTPMRAELCEYVGDKWQYNAKARSFFERLDGSNIGLMMAVNFGKLTQQKYVRDGLKDLAQLTFNIIFGLTIYAVYGLSFIALFIVLLVRLVVLWVAVALSPLIAIGIVLPGVMQGFSVGEGGSPADTFIQHAIAPLVIGVFMSIGYIMLDAMRGDPGAAGARFAGVSLTSVDPNALPTGMADLQQLMVAVGAVAVVWMGVFKAAEKTMASGITNTIKEHAQSLGKWVGTLPMYAQVIPVGGEGGSKLSLMGAFRSFGQAQSKFEEKFGKSFFEMADEKTTNDAGKIKNASNSQLPETLHDNLYTLKHPSGLEAIKYQLKKMGVEDKDLSAAKDHKDIAQLIYESQNPRVNELKRGLQRKGLNTKDQFISKAEQDAQEQAANTAKKPASGAVQKPVEIKDQETAQKALSDIAGSKNATGYSNEGAFGNLSDPDKVALATQYNSLDDAHKKDLAVFNANTGQVNVEAIRQAAAGQRIASNDSQGLTGLSLSKEVLQPMVDKLSDQARGALNEKLKADLTASGVTLPAPTAPTAPAPVAVPAPAATPAGNGTTTDAEAS